MNGKFKLCYVGSAGAHLGFFLQTIVETAKLLEIQETSREKNKKERTMVRNKIDSGKEALSKRRVDFEMIREANLRGRSPPVIEGFQSFRADHKKITRGSVMYIRRGYIQTSVG